MSFCILQAERKRHRKGLNYTSVVIVMIIVKDKKGGRDTLQLT